ncbi:MAG: hypothetical protein HRT89_11750, partial [Lentisphaeria bacterium]|nr:hypothetical protein [Lentisphaeria bacterium]
MADETYNCEPTLTDKDVMDFCRKGFLMLEGVVPDEINQKTIAYLEENPSHEPKAILDEDWFIEHVIKNPQAVGAVRSLLGSDFLLPDLMSNHRRVCPE